MWDMETVTTIYLTPDSNFSEIVVNKLTEKVSEDLEIQEQNHGEVIAWVPENISSYYRKLLVAAPDLFEALTELLDQLEAIGIPEWSGAEGLSLDQARNAIAKATGENHA